MLTTYDIVSLKRNAIIGVYCNASADTSTEIVNNCATSILDLIVNNLESNN